MTILLVHPKDGFSYYSPEQAISDWNNEVKFDLTRSVSVNKSSKALEKGFDSVIIIGCRKNVFIPTKWFERNRHGNQTQRNNETNL